MTAREVAAFGFGVCIAWGIDSATIGSPFLVMAGFAALGAAELVIFLRGPT